MDGMRGYFSRFPDTDRKSRVMLLTTTFRTCLGTLFEPDFEPTGDPRLDILFEVAELLDGVLFTPSSLRDARGRILFGAGGTPDEDPDAVWPRVEGEVPEDSAAWRTMHEISRPKPPDEVGESAEAPAPARVVRRALTLTALTARAILERDEPNDEARATQRNIVDWVEELNLSSELEPFEKHVLQTPVGRLASQEMIDAAWRLEGLVVLAWALGRMELPPHDGLVAPNALWDSLGYLDASSARELLENPRIRKRGAIAALRNRLFAVHWRLRNFHLDRTVMDFAEFARTCWFGPLDIEGLPLVDGDLGLRGQRLDRASPEIFGTAHSTAQERHLAANWLLDGPEQYSQASVAT
jgi:hypothetical protein